MTDHFLNGEYLGFIESLKKQVTETRYRAARSVNRELILLYHRIGTAISTKQKEYGWGSKFIKNLSRDLSLAFPEMKGFSERNLLYMKQFSESYQDAEFTQQLVAQLPWGHIVYLLNFVPSPHARHFYMQSAVEHGWSRSVLSRQVDLRLYERQGKAATNFSKALPSPQSDLALHTLKDPYIFDFLSIGKEAHEREMEKSLVTHMEKFLLELGAGFSFVGRQQHLCVDGQDFYIDLLFYHLKLRCYVVIELKDHAFKPEYAGKMSFYLSAVDDLIRNPGDNPSIGVVLCKTKSNVLVEYTLRDNSKPIGIAEYRLENALPDELKSALPSIAELEAELSKNL